MSFQSMMGDGNGHSSNNGYANPTPQHAYGGQSHSNPWASHPPQSPGSPAYGTEFAHSHTHDADPFVAASSQVAISIETISLNYREIRNAIPDINTPKDTVEFRNALYVLSITKELLPTRWKPITWTSFMKPQTQKSVVCLDPLPLICS